MSYLNRISFIGLAGGVVVTGMLLHPLYEVLPGQYVEGWRIVSDAMVAPSFVIALLTLLLTGFMAVKFTNPPTRSARLLVGTVSGTIAALIAFLTVGAPAAGIIGTENMLAYGMRPAVDDAHMMQILIPGVVMPFWTIGGTLVAFLLAGITAGGLGGMVAGFSSQPAEADTRGLGLSLTLMTIAGALNVVVVVVVFILLESTVRDVQAEYNLGMASWRIDGLTWIPFLMAFTPYLLAATGLYAVVRQHATADITADTADRHPLIVGVAYAALVGSTAIMTLVMIGNDFFAALPLLLLAAVFQMGLMVNLLRLVVRMRRRLVDAGLVWGLSARQQQALGGYALGLALIWVGLFVNGPFFLAGLFIIVVAFIAAALEDRRLSQHHKAKTDVPQSVPDIYRMYIDAALPSVTGVSLATLLWLPLALTLTLIPVVMIVPLNSYEDTGLTTTGTVTLAEMVTDLYHIHFQMVPVFFVGLLIATTGMTLVVYLAWLAYARWQRRTGHEVDVPVRLVSG